MGKKVFKSILKIAPSIIGAAVAGPAGAAIGSGVGTLASGGNIGQSLLSAGGSYLGGSLLGNSNFVPGDSIGSGLAGLGAGNIAAQLPASLAGSTLSGTLGSFVGSSLGENAGESVFDEAAKPKTTGTSQFTPSRASQLDAPLSLSQFGALTPEQQSSQIATQGVYGGGAGGDENQYFLNLINRKLVNDQGQTDSDLSEISGIENSYLNQLGISGYDSPYELLRGINGYRA